MLNKLLSN